MDNSANLPGGQLPPVQNEGSNQQQPNLGAGSPAPSSPTVALTPAQAAQAAFADSTLTPYQLSQRFIQLKSGYLASQGVITDGQG